MALVIITKSVGRGGQNLTPDVVKIGAALVAIGPGRGGVTTPPLTIEGLGQAIEAFQKFQSLPLRKYDGKVDPNGATLRRINEVINLSIPPTPPTQEKTNNIRPMRNAASLPANVDRTATPTPIEASLVSELVFKWGNVPGKGKISYFELDENVTPKWFGVLVPEGVSSFDKAHIFFHPTPGQVKGEQGQMVYLDSNYQGLGNWANIFHYLYEGMGAQFCAAQMGRVMVMPLMTNGAAGNCGIFPQRWEEIVGQIFGMLKSGNMSGSAPAASISSVVVSSFSSGITYSHHFRNKANLGARLTGVIDFDGAFSTYRQLSASVGTASGRVIRMQQMWSAQNTLGMLAAQNIFPLDKHRLGDASSPLVPAIIQSPNYIHGAIPQTMMFIAARRAG